MCTKLKSSSVLADQELLYSADGNERRHVRHVEESRLCGGAPGLQAGVLES